MSAYIKSDTNFGKSVFKNANDNGNKVIVDSIVLSQTKLNPNNLSSATLASLPNSIVFPIIDVKSDSNYYYAISSIDNDKINDNQFISNTLALVAHSNGDNSKDIIIAVIDNDPMVLSPNTTGFNQETVIFKLSNPIELAERTNSNQANVDLSNYVNQQQLNNALGSYVNDSALSNTLSGYATQSYAGDQYQNAVNTAKTYSDNNQIIGMPKENMKPGDSFDNYNGKAVHLNLEGINPVQDVGGGNGLPNAPINGDFITIPNQKATTQIINDDLGNRWSSVVGKDWHVMVNADMSGYDKTAIRKISLINPDDNKFKFNDVYAIYDPVKRVVSLHGSITSINNVSDGDRIALFNISNLNMNKVNSSWLNFQSMTTSVDNTLNYAQLIGGGGHAQDYTWNLDGCTINLDYDPTLKPKFNPDHIDLITDSSNYDSKDSYGQYDANNKRIKFTGKINATNYPSFDSNKPIFYVELSDINATNAYNIGFNDTYYKVTFNNNKAYVYPTANAEIVYDNNHGFDITGGSIGINI